MALQSSKCNMKCRAAATRFRPNHLITTIVDWDRTLSCGACDTTWISHKAKHSQNKEKSRAALLFKSTRTQHVFIHHIIPKDGACSSLLSHLTFHGSTIISTSFSSSLPFRNSNPTLHGRHSSPLPPTHYVRCAPTLLSREKLSMFFPRRLASNFVYIYMNAMNGMAASVTGE